MPRRAVGRQHGLPRPPPWQVWGSYPGGRTSEPNLGESVLFLWGVSAHGCLMSRRCVCKPGAGDAAPHGHLLDPRAGSPGFGVGGGGWPRRQDCRHCWSRCPELKAGGPERGGMSRCAFSETTVMPHGDGGPGRASSCQVQPSGPSWGPPKGPLRCRASPASPLLPQRTEGRSLNAPLVSCRLKALAATGRKTAEEACDW